MQDRPNAQELLAAVERFLEREVVPALAGPKQYHARVAANVMRILAREVEQEPGHLRAEWQGLDQLLGREPAPAAQAELKAAIARRNGELGARIRGGEADAGDWRAAVLKHVREVVEAKLRVAKPEML